MTEHRREDLFRMTPLTRAELRADGDDGNTLVGYPVVFNQWTEIDSLFEGRFLERVAPGALTKTLTERADRVVVLFDHGMDTAVGNRPLGKPRVMEPRSFGLWTETPLDDTSYNRDLKASLASGALAGMSFRFTVTRDEWNQPDQPADHNPHQLEERTIHELRLYEFGPVTFPAYEATTAGVRSAAAYQRWNSAQQTTTTNKVTVDAAQPGTSTPPDDTPPPRHLSRVTIAAKRRHLHQARSTR